MQSKTTNRGNKATSQSSPNEEVWDPNPIATPAVITPMQGSQEYKLLKRKGMPNQYKKIEFWDGLIGGGARVIKDTNYFIALQVNLSKRISDSKSLLNKKNTISEWSRKGVTEKPENSIPDFHLVKFSN